MKVPNGTNGKGHKAPHATTPRDLLAILFRQRRVLLVSAALIFFGVVSFALLLSDRYQAQTLFLVTQDERADPVVSPGVNAQPDLNHNGVTVEEMNSEVALLLSRDLLEEVVDKCGLASKPLPVWSKLLGGWSLSKEQRVDKAVRRLADKLDIEVEKMSNIISVSYDSSDPELAAQVVRTLSDVYLKKHAAVHRPPGPYEFFENETEQYRKKLAQSEAQLVSFTKSGGVVSAQLETAVVLQKLNDLEAMHVETQAAIAEARQKMRWLDAKQASMLPRMTTQVMTVDNAQLLQQLKGTLLELELKRTALLEKFAPDYRPVKEIETEIAQTRDAIAGAEKAQWRQETTDRDPNFELVREELTKTSAALAGLEARTVALARGVQTFQTKAQWFEQQGMVQDDLLRATKVAEDNYLLYLRKQEEARISNALDTRGILNVTVAQAAAVPSLPTHSNVWYVALGGLLAGLGSIGLAFGFDSLDTTLRTPGEVESVLNIPLLAALPKEANGKANGKAHGNGKGNGRSVIHVS